MLILERLTEFADRVRGEWMAPWGAAELKRLGLYERFIAAGGHHLSRAINYDELLTREQECEFRVAGEFIFVNSTRLRLDLDNYTSFSALLTQFRQNGIGTLRTLRAPATRDWTVLLGYMMNPQGADAASRYDALQKRLLETNVTAFDLAPLVESDEDSSGERVESKETLWAKYRRLQAQAASSA